MDCNIIKDLIPLYADDCCSEESRKTVEKHIGDCPSCRQYLEDVKTPAETITSAEAPAGLNRIKDWKASVLQSALMFLSFAIITLGVALEARAYGFVNGVWAFNLVVPATGFMLSMANWCFVRTYKSRKIFSACSSAFSLVLIGGAFLWTCFHYKMSFIDGEGFGAVWKTLRALWIWDGMGIILTLVLCVASGLLSNQYAKMLGKE